MGITPLLTTLDSVQGATRIREDDSRKRTQAEIAADVTPVNYAFRALDVTRYGATGDGVTNDAPAFQAAIDVAREIGGYVYIPAPPVSYLLEDELDCTYVSGETHVRGLSFYAEAGAYAGRPSIVAKHTGTAVFDCSGNLGINFYDLNIGTHASTYPKTCFFLARNAIEDSQIHRFYNVRVDGKFSDAILYNYGSEEDIYVGGQWFNHASNAGAKVGIWTANNIRSLNSSFITIATGRQSCIGHTLYGGSFFMDSSDAAADVFLLDESDSWKWDGAWAWCAGSGGKGRSLVYVDTSNGPTNFGNVTRITGEQSLSPAPSSYGVMFSNDSAVTCTGWQIKHCVLPTDTRAIWAGADIICDDFDIGHIQEPQATKGIEIVGALQKSTVEAAGIPLLIGTSKWNRLRGQVDTWTVTARVGDIWEDTRIDKAWVADVSALTITGGLAVNRGRSEYHDTRVSVQLLLQANTSIVCAAGTAIGDLPEVPEEFGTVTVVDATTGALVGCGYVDQGGDIRLPAINVTTKLLIISATYAVAADN